MNMISPKISTTPLKDARPWLEYSEHDLFYFHAQGRIDERVWSALKLAIRWASPRLSSYEQERFYQTHGRRALYRKIERVRKAFGMDPLAYPSHITPYHLESRHG